VGFEDFCSKKQQNKNMANLNQVNLIGRLTRDLELTHTTSGTPVASMSLAINAKYKTQSGETREKCTYVEVETWGALAELCSKYLAKSRQVYVGGRLELDTWESNGQKRQKLKVVAESVQFIDSSTKPESPNKPRRDEHGEVPF
jgi:single-strand DNA-binding protein